MQKINMVNCKIGDIHRLLELMWNNDMSCDVDVKVAGRSEAVMSFSGPVKDVELEKFFEQQDALTFQIGGTNFNFEQEGIIYGMEISDQQITVCMVDKDATTWIHSEATTPGVIAQALNIFPDVKSASSKLTAEETALILMLRELKHETLVIAIESMMGGVEACEEMGKEDEMMKIGLLGAALGDANEDYRRVEKLLEGVTH
ncbi:hypothetical protein PA598K_06891 [Paenibacillus sp. 598K]|uniref:hypothetical protein n=1 Tax=Paenibacillus sp. 598K TaxID=1117987 RepID=UPI000FF9534A|nr:hypothetical protein [Paenibacillus sp. 598K]GBF78273.1 hypothetical protein PA598K_06891 [Paenibacillus sp. 598K]